MYLKPLPSSPTRSPTRHQQVVDEHLVGAHSVSAHLVDRPDVDVVTVEVGQEQRHAVGLLGHLVIRRGSREKQDLLGLDRLGDPDLPPVDAVVVALALGECGDARGVQARTGFGHAEADVQVAVDDPGQRGGLQLVGAVLDDGLHPEDRQVDGAGTVHRRAGARDLLQEQRRLGDAEAVAAVLLRDGHAQPAALGDRVVELLREFVRLVLLHPVVVVELARQLGNRLSDQFLILAQLETHPVSHCTPPLPRRHTAECAGAIANFLHRRTVGKRTGSVLVAGQFLCVRREVGEAGAAVLVLAKSLDGHVVALGRFA